MESFEKEPAPHAAHDDDAGLAAKKPTPHGAHDALTAAAEPAAQAVQLAAAARDSLPGGHWRHAAPPNVGK